MTFLQQRLRIAAGLVAKNRVGILPALAHSVEGTGFVDINWTGVLDAIDGILVRMRSRREHKLPRPDRYGTPLHRWDKIAAINRLINALETRDE